MGIYQEWAERLAQQIPEGSDILEIAPGPGYLAIELAKRKRCKIIALEISETFVEIARDNAAKAGVEVDFRQGNASAMPFETGTFDFVVCTSAFKNFSEPVKALQEMHRVLKADGKAWISDLRRDVSDRTIRDFVANQKNVKGLAAFSMRYNFTHALRPRAYSGDQFREMAIQAGFTSVEIKNNAIDFEALLDKSPQGRSHGVQGILHRESISR